MAKRNVQFTKPEEPAFLKRIKQEIGYKEVEDDLNLKRGPISNLSDDEDYEERDDEKPQVVQLKEGDLTESEAQKFLKDEDEKPADLTKKVIFKAKKKKDEDGGEKSNDSSKSEKPEKSSRKSKKLVKNLLSFGDDEEEEDE